MSDVKQAPGRALLFVVAAYAGALGVAWTVALALPQLHPLYRILAADLAATAVVFAFSVAFDNSSFYDPYWSVAPLVIAPFLVGVGTGWQGERELLVTGLVWLWGLRLTWNWLQGWQGLRHEDWRYADFRARGKPVYWAVSLTGFHLMPTLMVFLGCFGLYPALVEPTQPLGWLDLVAVVVTFGAVLIETVADLQLHEFAKVKQPGEIMARGLWAFSRHPNYFGEVAFWWGVWLLGVAANPTMALWTLAGPVAMTFLFLVVSIPLIDKRSKARRPGYAEHIQRVSRLVPWFPKAALPPGKG